jgi:hypothetical protein
LDVIQGFSPIFRRQVQLSGGLQQNMRVRGNMVPVFKKKRYVLGVLLAVVLTVIIFLPLILSSDTVLRLVVSRINSTVPGRLSIQSWLIDWQQGVLCQDIVYTDERKGLRITIPRLTSTQGLLELIFAPRNLGLVGVDSPVVEFYGSVPAGKGAPKSEASTSSSGDTAAWDRLVLQFQVRDGLVKTGLSDAKGELGLKGINLHANLANGVIDFSLKFQALGEQGVVEAKGSLNLPARSRDLLETLIVSADVTVDNYQFRDVLSFLAPRSNLPVGEGILNADFRLRVVGIEELTLSGTAGMTDVRLSGGVLGEDTPAFQEISLSLEETEWSGRYWAVKQLSLESDAGTMYFSGEQKNNRLQFKSRGTLQIPVLFDRFPHLLRVQEATLIESGSLDFTADLSLDGPQGKLDVKARTENLGGLFNGNAFVWDSPLTVALLGEKNGLDFRIRRLQVDAPFVQAYGSGNLRSFELEASADVGTALVEIGKLFQHSWSGTGKLELEAKASGGEPDDKNYTVVTDLNISNFSLSRSGTVIVPRNDFSIVTSGSGPLSLLKDKKGMFDLQFALSSWLGDIFLTLNGERGEEGLTGSRYSTDTNLDLAGLSTFLLAVGELPVEAKVSGDLQVQAAGYVDRTTLEVDELNSSIQDFSFARDDFVVHEKKVSLRILQSVNDEVPSLVIHDMIVSDNREQFFSAGAGSNSIQIPDRSLFLHNISLESGAGRLRLDELIIPDWQQPLQGARTDFSLQSNLAELTRLLQSTNLLEPWINLSGTGQLDFRAVQTENAGQDIQAELQLDDFFLSRKGADLLNGEKASLATHLSGRIIAADFAIDEFRLSSEPLDMIAAGTLQPAEHGKILEFQGEMTPKLDRLASIVNNVFGLGMTMQGQKKESFQLRYHLGGIGGKETHSNQLSTSLYADRLEYKGFVFSALKMPISLEENKLHVELSGRMNDGTLNLVSDSDFTVEPPVLRIPPASRILSDVQLGKPVVDNLLQGVHPLFGVLATPTGTIDVTVDSLTWPLVKDGAADADFVTIINTSQVSFSGTAFMQGILSSFGLDRENLTLQESKIYCTGQNGRIACSPIRILAGDSEMVLSGSVGMDKSLDYLLQVPVTEKLVGREGYRILEGTTVRVPIRGTSGRPTFDKKMVAGAIEDLAKQAAVKAIEKKAEEILPGLVEGILGPLQQK